MKIQDDSLGEEQLGKLGEEEEEPATEQRREYADLGLDVEERGRRASRLPCLSLGDDRQGMSGNGDVSMTIFMTCVSGSKIFASFTNRSFHFRRPPGFTMAFDAAERNEKFVRIHCQGGAECSSKRKRQVFLC